MDNLGDFFSLIGEEKKKTKEKTKEIIGDVSLDDLFSNLKEEKKKLQKKEDKKLQERKKLIKQAKVFESFLFNEPKKVDTTDWKDDYKPLEIESVDIIKPEPLKASKSPIVGEDVTDWVEKIEEEIAESVEELETLSKIRDDVDVEVDKSTNMLKSIEILDKLTPDEEIDSDGKDSEVNRLRREIDQLRKMVYETVRHTSTIGGGGAGFIKDLDDVNIDGLKNGYVLVWDQANNHWKVEEKAEETNFGPLAGLATADPTSLQNGSVVVFNAVSGQFITTSSVGAATTNIAGFPVDTSTPSDNAVIAFNQAGQNWVFDTPFQVVDLSDGVEDGHQDYGSFE